MVPSTSSSILASTLDFESVSKVSPSRPSSSPRKRAERAGERAVVLVEQLRGAAGDLVDRGGDPRLEPVLELGERPLDHVDVDAHVRRPQRPGADAQAGAGGGDRVVGLGDDAGDLGVVLLELADVHDAVGDQDPALGLDDGYCAHGPRTPGGTRPPAASRSQYPGGV